RLERPRTRGTTPRVMLRLAPRTDGSFDVLRVVLDGRGQELAAWRGTARLRGAALECTFPARRGLVGAIEQEEASKWGARAAYRFSRDGATISGKFSLLGPDGKVRETVVESGTRTRK